MESIETTYKNLTGVDIAQQQRIWDERGKGYYGEYLVFSELYRNVTGACKILMNLEIPSNYGKTTEIDLVLIHETGLYVFEIKHYKGTIYGNANDETWTQYFRTTSNKHFFNPIVQNRLHISALERLFPNIPMHSYIVFTNSECDVKVATPPAGISVCTLQELTRDMAPRLAGWNTTLSMSKIDSIFTDLKKFSPMLSKPVPVDGDVIPFSDYLQTLNLDYMAHMANQTAYVQSLESDYQTRAANQEAAYVEKTQRFKTRAVALTVCGLAACVAFSCTAFNTAQRSADEATAEAEQRISEAEAEAEQRISAAEDAMAEFAQKFEHVEEFNDGDISFSENLVAVSDVVLEESSDIVNTVNFSCKLTPTSSTYGINIEEDAVLIVILKDGSVKEYDLWNETYPYNRPVQVTGMVQVGLHEFYDIGLSDISYVKLANLGVWKHQQYKRNNVASGYEVELYSTK